jgi:predicted DNA-binding transcriptional regulator AlpA
MVRSIVPPCALLPALEQPVNAVKIVAPALRFAPDRSIRLRERALYAHCRCKQRRTVSGFATMKFLLRLGLLTAIVRLVPFSRATLYREMEAGRFPAVHEIAPRLIAWFAVLCSLDPAWRDGDSQNRLSEKGEQIAIKRRCLAVAFECLAKAGPWKALRLGSRPDAMARTARDPCTDFLSDSFAT